MSSQVRCCVVGCKTNPNFKLRLRQLVTCTRDPELCETHPHYICRDCEKVLRERYPPADEKGTQCPANGCKTVVYGSIPIRGSSNNKETRNAEEKAVRRVSNSTTWDEFCDAVADNIETGIMFDGVYPPDSDMGTAIEDKDTRARLSDIIEVHRQGVWTVDSQEPIETPRMGHYGTRQIRKAYIMGCAKPGLVRELAARLPPKTMLAAYPGDAIGKGMLVYVGKNVVVGDVQIVNLTEHIREDGSPNDVSAVWEWTKETMTTHYDDFWGNYMKEMKYRRDVKPSVIADIRSATSFTLFNTTFDNQDDLWALLKRCARRAP
jgi:hypothetical protein